MMFRESFLFLILQSHHFLFYLSRDKKKKFHRQASRETYFPNLEIGTHSHPALHYVFEMFASTTKES